MLQMTRCFHLLGFVGLLALSAMSLAQRQPDPIDKNAQPKTGVAGNGTINLQCNIGSCRLIDGKGQVAISWSGTLLLNKYEGAAPIVTGNVRVEFDEHKRKAYFGTGKIILDGKFRGIQWFGKSFSAKWFGSGMMRLYGEFDRNGNTGTYWYGGAEAEKKPWGQFGLTVLLPNPNQSEAVVPKRRGGG